MTCLFGAPLIESTCVVGVVVVEPPVFVEPVVFDEPFVAAGLLFPPSSPLQAASMRVRRIVTVPNAFFDFDPCMRAPKVFPWSSAARARSTVQDNGRQSLSARLRTGCVRRSHCRRPEGR